MKLADWLAKNRIKRVDFAARINVQPSVITAWCADTYKPNKKHARKLADETGGEVTLNDFVEDEEAA